MQILSLDLTAVLSETIPIARAAGQLLREHAARPRLANHKGTVIDLVTEADRQSEALIVGRLRELFPDHHIVGEEGGSYGYENGNRAPAPYHWYIDPLDGTTNFAHGIPHFSTSIAMTGSDGFPLVGVVYDPTRDECFAGAHGLGATLNGQPLRVSTIDTLALSVLASGFPYDKWDETDNNAQNWANFVPRTSGERRFGSAALDMAYVAAGRFDGYWEHKVNPWDVLAGVVLVLEAGGKVTDYDGGAGWLNASKMRLVASNGLIHTQIMEVLRLGKNAPRPAR